MNQFCKICNSKIEFLFTAKVLHKYKINYFCCPTCEFIQTQEPFWLKEAYNNVITNSDVGLLSRNLALKKEISKLLNKNFDIEKEFLDFAGGYGVFTRLMRDIGYDFYWVDPYCENLFAKGFDIQNFTAKTNHKFEALTTFEVFEHLENPLEEIKKCFQYSDVIIFSTELIPSPSPKQVVDWWYFVPQTGQHISFFSEKTLQFIATKNNYNLYTNKLNLHILSYKKLKNPFMENPWNRFLSLVNKITDYLKIKPKLQSKLSEDYQKTINL
ncbi:MAG: class I SAM-dependent methyltransferase [Chitinophagaceae bacterium]